MKSQIKTREEHIDFMVSPMSPDKTRSIVEAVIDYAIEQGMPCEGERQEHYAQQVVEHLTSEDIYW